MSDDRPHRRVPIRWITLAEAVAIAAVLISGLGLYNSWRERADPPPPAAAVPGGKPLTLRATADKEGERLILSPAVEAQIVQSQTIAFPTALGLAPVDTTGDPRIEADWVNDALKKAAGDGKVAGDRRVPLLVTTRYVEDGADRTDASLYHLGYALEEGGLFGGRHVRLRGLSLIAHGAKDGRKRLDAMWKPAAR